MATLKPFLETLAGRRQPVPPVWLMRQAGRYLPEYREVRRQAGSFHKLMQNPETACEVTLQPIRRFGFDAAILFSDILVIPAALGQGVRFEDGRGPVLDAMPNISDLVFSPQRLNFVYDALRLIGIALRDEGFTRTALIGFAGAPWTVACYMVEGGGSKEFAQARALAYRDPEGMRKLIDLLTDATTEYLSAQIEAGAEAVQLFDSWAGLLPENQFRTWVIEPTRRIVQKLKHLHPHIPVIGFPRGAGHLYEAYLQETGVTALGLDERVDLRQAASLQSHVPVQGNLDPFALLAGGSALVDGIKDILGGLEAGPLVFNLGHGVHKDTPPEHVARLVARVRGLA